MLEFFFFFTASGVLDESRVAENEGSVRALSQVALTSSEGKYSRDNLAPSLIKVAVEAHRVREIAIAPGVV